jgi:DNA polymerase I-like protein with 3'-5' exonuclease and polymerase domains
MGVLQLAREAFARVVRERNGVSTAHTGYEINERNEESTPASPPPVAGTPLMLVTDAAGLEAARSALEDTALVGLDLETTGLNPRTDRVRLLSLCCDTTDGGGFTYVIDCCAVDPSPLWPVLAGRPVVAHNAAFDLQFLAALGFEPAAPVHCTMLLSQLVYGTRKPKGFHGLAQAAARELGRALDKDGQKSNWSGTLAPWQLEYAADDAAVLPPLYEALAAAMKESGQDRAADAERRCLPAVAWLSRSGVEFDRPPREALAAEADAEAADLARLLDDAAPPRPGHFAMPGAWNWSSPPQVAEAFALLGVKLDKTDDDALAAVDHPMADLLRKYRAASKRASTYGARWFADALERGRIYAGWRQIGADSGRMACASPNLQNLPRDPRYRRCFVAPPGRVLVKADYSQIELRIAALIADDKAMLAAYGRGEDLHTATARLVLGVAHPTKEQRQIAKSLNFGLLYGMGHRGLRIYARSSYGVELTEEQARDYRAAFFRAYPGLARWHEQVRRKRAPESRTLAGRRRLFHDKTPDTQRLNTPVQGTGADGLKLALALLWERRGECPGAIPVLAVHDEIVIETDASRADDAADWLRRAMRDGMAPLIAPVPCEVEVKAGRTWGGD